jgi:hypothetical protein
MIKPIEFMDGLWSPERESGSAADQHIQKYLYWKL